MNMKEREFWFVVGSQHLYGPETLEQVRDHAREMARSINRSKRIKQVSEHTLTLYALLTGTILFAAMRAIRGGDMLEGIDSGADWLNLTGLALVPTMISMLTLAISSRCIGPTKTSVLGVFEPLTAILIGTVMFGEPISLKMAAGILVCVAAVVFMILKPGRKS